MSNLVDKLRRIAEERAARFNQLAERQQSSVRLDASDYDEWKAADEIERLRALLQENTK